jgi:hypothetical protein
MNDRMYMIVSHFGHMRVIAEVRHTEPVILFNIG